MDIKEAMEHFENCGFRADGGIGEEAWQTLNDFVLAQQPHNKQSTPCQEDLCPECTGSDMSNKCAKCGMWF